MKNFSHDIAEKLKNLYPEHSVAITKNLAQLTTQFAESEVQIAKRLDSVKRQPYLLYHDNLQYFESHFKLGTTNFIYEDPSVSLSLKQYENLEKIIRLQNIKCIYAEEQFSASIVQKLKSKFDIKLFVIDVLGRDYNNGDKGSYFKLMERIADSLNQCSA